MLLNGIQEWSMKVSSLASYSFAKSKGVQFQAESIKMYLKVTISYFHYFIWLIFHLYKLVKHSSITPGFDLSLKLILAFVVIS